MLLHVYTILEAYNKVLINLASLPSLQTSSNNWLKLAVMDASEESMKFRMLVVLTLLSTLSTNIH